MAYTTVRKIVLQTVRIIWSQLQPLEMPLPDEAMWKDIASDFFKRWNFPLCLGAIDGKHVRTRPPSNSEASYDINYKGHSSVMLIAVVDGKGRFVIVDVDAYGRNACDRDTFHDSALYKMLAGGRLSLPEPTTIPDTNIEAPYVFVADGAFPLKKFLMRPFPKRDITNDNRTFDERLLRARRLVDCAFDVASSSWPVLKGMEVEDSFACDIIKAVCVLHNFVLNKEEEICTPTDPMSQQELKSQMTISSLSPCGKRPSIEALNIREKYMSYFTSPVGSLSSKMDKL